MGLETPLDSAPEPPGFSRGEVQILPPGPRGTGETFRKRQRVHRNAGLDP